MSSISIVPAGSACGALLHGLDLAKPSSDETFEQVCDTFYRYGVKANFDYELLGRLMHRTKLEGGASH